jgi:hypothetical protein
MKELIVETIRNEVWLKCPRHGLVKCFGGPYVNLSEIVVAEQEHATFHLRQVHDLTDAK